MIASAAISRGNAMSPGRLESVKLARQRVLVALAIALLASALAASPARAERHEDLYRQAVHILGGNANVVHKWGGPIQFVAIGDPAFAPLASAIVSRAAKIADLAVSFPEIGIGSAAEYESVLRAAPPHTLGARCPDEPGRPCFNFVVVFADAPTMLAIAAATPLRKHYGALLRADPDTPCFFAPYLRARYEIHQTLIYVRADLSPEMKRTCLAEEIYQSLGLFQDYTDSSYFSFNNRIEPKRITRYDEALLRALYDPRVTLGYPVNRVVGIFLEGLGY